MVSFLLRSAYACFVLALAYLGARWVSGDPSQPWREVIVPWLQWIGIPLALFVTATVMTVVPITKWVLDRRYARDLQRQIRANLRPNAFRDTDAAEALRYLLHESVWGWKAYTQFNSWTLVDGMQLWEFERASREGEVVTTGYSSRENERVVIDRRYWVDGRIDRDTATKPYGVIMSIGVDSLRRMTWSQSTHPAKTAWVSAQAA